MPQRLAEVFTAYDLRSTSLLPLVDAVIAELVATGRVGAVNEVLEHVKQVARLGFARNTRIAENLNYFLKVHGTDSSVLANVM